MFVYLNFYTVRTKSQTLTPGLGVSYTKIIFVTIGLSRCATESLFLLVVFRPVVQSTPTMIWWSVSGMVKITQKVATDLLLDGSPRESLFTCQPHQISGID